jgi:putative hydrolase of HD superfamily
LDGIRKFIFEAGSLKRVNRSGWWLAGIKNPESVAEHSWRTSVIAHVLAGMENLPEQEAQRAVLLCVFHDLPEARLGDLHKVGATYVEGFSSALKNAAKAQSKLLPAPAGNAFLHYYEEFEAGKTRAAIVAKDADLVEAAFQAAEYMACGFSDAKEWIVHARARVKTKSAKKLLEGLEKKRPGDWFEGLKTFR